MKYYEKKQEIISLLENLESKLISNLASRPQEIIKASTFITDNDFSQTRFKDAYNAVMESVIKNRDLYSVLKERKIELSSLIKNFEYAQVDQLSRELKKFSKINKTVDLLQTSVNSIDIKSDIDSYISSVQNDLVKINSLSSNKSTDIKSLLGEFDTQRDIYANKTSLLGIDTGFPKLNEMIDGIRKGHLWIIGGYTSTGKTNMSLNILKSVIKNKKRAVYYSLEMGEFDIISRTLAIMSGQKVRDVSKKKDLDIAEAHSQIENSRLNIITDINDISKIKMSMIEQNMIEPVDIFFVDFLQIIKSIKSDNEYEVMRSVSHEMQEIAKHLQIPVIALSQINNESAKSSESRMMGFKGAGDIAAASDLAIELNSAEESYEDFVRKMNKGEKVRVKCMIKKNRHGRVGSFLCLFDGETGIFEELSYAEPTVKNKIYDVRRNIKGIKNTLKEIEEDNNQKVWDEII